MTTKELITPNLAEAGEFIQKFAQNGYELSNNGLEQYGWVYRVTMKKLELQEDVVEEKKKVGRPSKQ